MTENNERCDRQQATDNRIELAREIKDALHKMGYVNFPVF